jgi:hypothetical protein
LSDPIEIEIHVSDAELDAEIAKIESVTQQKQNSTKGSGVSEADTFVSPEYNRIAQGVGSDEYEGYAAMREQQRNDMFSAEDSSGFGSELEAGRATHAALGLMQGQLPTNFIMHQLLREIGVTGPMGILAVFGIDVAIKEIVALQVEQKFNDKMAKYEAQRKIDFASAQRGVITE